MDGHNSSWDRIIFFDTTSRDGKQSPGCNHTPEDTVTIARQLAKMRVDIMEAGFPISSESDFESVRRVAREVPEIRCCALARAKEADIIRAAESLEKSTLPPRIHTFIGSSRLHMENKLRMSEEEVIAIAVEAISLARKYCDDVEFSPEDSLRSDFPMLCRIVKEAIMAGATTINIPDTVGYAVGAEYGSRISQLISEVPEIRANGVIISTHCHNDLEQAVANTLSGVENGARQVECTINGIGERAGNAHFAPVAMALLVRQDYYKVNIGIDTTQIGPTAHLVSAITQKAISDTAPIVGAGAFAHSSGIHQDGTLKDRRTYEIIRPKDVGWKGEEFPLTSQSGRHGLKSRLSQIGYTPDGPLLQTVYQRFSELAAAKKFVHNADLHMLMQETISEKNSQSEHWIRIRRIDYHKVGEERSVTIHLSQNGDVFEASGTGNGPASSTWDAIQNALKRKGLWPGDIFLTDFDVGKCPGGIEALGIATVEIRLDHQIAYGRGTDTDIIVAYAKAHIAAINHLANAPITKSTAS